MQDDPIETIEVEDKEEKVKGVKKKTKKNKKLRSFLILSLFMFATELFPSEISSAPPRWFYSEEPVDENGTHWVLWDVFPYKVLA